jgi:hypothetical protein
LLHVFLDPPPRPCTKIKSIRGSDGEYKRFNPRGPLKSPTPSSTTVFAVLNLLGPDTNKVNREKGLPIGDESISLREALDAVYGAFSRGSEKSTEPLTLLSCILPQTST